MAGPPLWVKEEFGPAVKGAEGVTVNWPCGYLVTRNSPVAGRETLPFWQGFWVRTPQGMGCV